ncbi:MAG: hypothetical protein NTY09_04625 [bacterium]|nr:hypothetical protein [bacterium]
MKSTNELPSPLRYILGILAGIISGITFLALVSGALKLGEIITSLLDH